MKKLLMYAPIAALMAFSSCAQEDGPVNQTAEGNVHFNITVPSSIGTRVFSDGLTADDLEMAIYDATTDELVQIPDAKIFGNGLTTTVNLQLANGRSYKIAFFAHNKANSAYEFDPVQKVINVDYSKMAENYNTDAHDCFYTLYTTPVITEELNQDITLTRPVAQVNWGTSDLSAPIVTAENSYGKDENGEAKNLVTNVNTVTAYTQFSILDSDVVEDSKTGVDLGYLARPTGETFPVKSSEYKYLSMCYLLVPKTGITADLTLEIKDPTDVNARVGKVIVPGAPLQANYRTNIYGALLTNPANFTVTKDTLYTDEFNHDNHPDYGTELTEGLFYNKANKTYSITTADGFRALGNLPAAKSAKMANFITGARVVLTCDVDLENKVMEPINMWVENVVFDGQNHTISNVALSGTTNTLFKSLMSNSVIKNLNVVNMNGNVTARFAGLIGNCYGLVENVHVKNVKLTSTEGRIGAIVGIHNSHPLINCSVENVDITGVWSVGGMVGGTGGDYSSMPIPSYTGCSVKNVKVTNTKDYGGIYNLMVGVFSGNLNTDSDLGKTIFTNCSVTGCDTNLPIYHTYNEYMWNGSLIVPDIDDDGNLIE